MEINRFLQFKFNKKHAADAFRHYCKKNLILNKRIDRRIVLVLLENNDDKIERKARILAEKVSNIFDN